VAPAKKAPAFRRTEPRDRGGHWVNSETGDETFLFIDSIIEETRELRLACDTQAMLINEYSATAKFDTLLEMQMHRNKCEQCRGVEEALDSMDRQRQRDEERVRAHRLVMKTAAGKAR
jgi:hypothetical protein